MVKLDVFEIQEIICFCGFLLVKLKVIYCFLEILFEKYQGVVFDNFEDLEEFFGVGYKIVFVVMLQVFDVLVFFVDIYIYWLFICWGIINGKSVE